MTSGDEEGLRRLLEDYAGRVRGALRKGFGHVLDDLEIDEAMSQAALRIWRTRSGFDARRGPLPAWFVVIARNCARRILAGRRRHDCARLTDVATPDGQDAQTAEGVGARAAAPLLQVVTSCIDALEPRQRAVLLADMAAGGVAPTAQVAAELCITPNSVYVARSTGRKALREALQSSDVALQLTGRARKGRS